MLEGLALRGEPRLRRMVLRGAADDQGRRRDLRVRHQPERQEPQDLHHAPAAARRHLGDHAVQPSAQHGEPQARAGDRHQQPRGAEADRADAADGAGARRRALRGGPAAGDAVGRDRQPLDDGRRHDHRYGRRPRHLHGLGQGRQAHRRDGGLQASRARARRQRSAHRHGGRRPRPRGRARRPGRDQELGPALHGGEAHPRREERCG